MYLFLTSKDYYLDINFVYNQVFKNQIGKKKKIKGIQTGKQEENSICRGYVQKILKTSFTETVRTNTFSKFQDTKSIYENSVQCFHTLITNFQTKKLKNNSFTINHTEKNKIIPREKIKQVVKCL